MEAQVTHKFIGRRGKAVITVILPDGKTYVDTVDAACADDRTRYVSNFCNQCPGIDPEGLSGAMESIAAEADRLAKYESESSGRKSQADKLVELVAEGCELFHDSNGGAYASFKIVHDGHQETWPVASRGFREFLAHRFFGEYGKTPSSQAIQDALGAIAGRAKFEGQEHPVATRLGGLNGRIYLDLVDPTWRVVEIAPGGWRIIPGAESPIRFIRRRGMLSIPEPSRGGSLSALRSLLNLADDGQWTLLVSFLVMALRPTGPYPILVVNGEQGSAKSTLCRFIRTLVDPNQAPLRRPPRDDRDLLIAATNGRMLIFDNLSGIKPELADVMCMVATGGGFATRQLYTDGEECLFDAQRPIVVNGIDDLATRPDLLDRAVVLHLREIDEQRRRPESELVPAFEAARPGIIGALLDATSVAFRDHGSVRGPFPRMADFCCWSVAAEPALGLVSGSFLKSYLGNRNESVESAIEASVIGPVILDILTVGKEWEGTATNLLDKVIAFYNSNDQVRWRRDIPTSARAVTSALERIVPDLRQIGIQVTKRRAGHDRTKMIRIRKLPPTPSAQSAPSASASSPDSSSESPASTSSARSALSATQSENVNYRRIEDREVGSV